MVDGYDELLAEFQEKVDFALQNGHVPDEDWKGVSPAIFSRKYISYSSRISSATGPVKKASVLPQLNGRRPTTAVK